MTPEIAGIIYCLVIYAISHITPELKIKRNDKYTSPLPWRSLLAYMAFLSLFAVLTAGLFGVMFTLQ